MRFFHNLNRCRLEAQGIFFSNFLRTTRLESTQKFPCNVASLNSKWNIHRLAHSSCQTFTAVYARRPFFCRIHSMPTSLEESASLHSEDNSSDDFDPSTDSEDEASSQPLTSKQVFLFIHLVVIFWKSYNCHLITECSWLFKHLELKKYILNIVWLS